MGSKTDQIKGLERFSPEQCRAAMNALHLAVSHLDGEPPDEVYTEAVQLDFAAFTNRQAA